MSRRIHPQQMEAWVDKLQTNMRTFLNTKTIEQESKVEFIRNQYIQFDIVSKVLEGKAYFLGCSHPSLKSNRD